MAVRTDFFERLWEESWTYIKTVVDVVREPMLILDERFRVMAANEPFYETFHVEPKDTENKTIYELGNGQWDIPTLRKLLEGILPKHTFFKGFEVSHEFPIIGQKVMILNARQIYPRFISEKTGSDAFPPIILLAIEDITKIMAVARRFATHTNDLETRLTKQTQGLEIQIKKLEGEIQELRKKTEHEKHM